ncbi:MAG: AAA family ATPase [bacterium]|nr:AAA family ATPase [bacterium]
MAKSEPRFLFLKSFDNYVKNLVTKVYQLVEKQKDKIISREAFIMILEKSNLIFRENFSEVLPLKKKNKIIEKIKKTPSKKFFPSKWAQILANARKISSSKFNPEIKVNHLFLSILLNEMSILDAVKQEKINLEKLNGFLLDNNNLSSEMNGWKSVKPKKVHHGSIKDEAKIPPSQDDSGHSSIKKDILELRKRLNKSIINQKQAIDDVIKILFLKKLGLDLNPETPAGIFMFIGQRGVGKTEFAKILAEEYFEKKSNIMKIDIGDFSDELDIFSLFGPMMGHLGTNEAGILSEAISRDPHQVILLKSIEKMPKSLTNVLIQIFDDGYIITKEGEKIFFSDCIFILTSNTKALVDKVKKIGFKLSKEQALSLEFLSDVLKEFFPIDFLNKIDKIIFFNPMTQKHFKEVLKYKIKVIEERLKEENKTISVKDSLIKYILDNKFNPAFGARGSDRTIEEFILMPIVDYIINNPDTDKLTLDIIKGKVKVN